jgi:hypothetical protein
MGDSELIANISIITIQSMLIPTRLMKKIDLEKAEYKEENSNTGNLKGVIKTRTGRKTRNTTTT